MSTDPAPLRAPAASGFRSRPDLQPLGPLRDWTQGQRVFGATAAGVVLFSVAFTPFALAPMLDEWGLFDAIDPSLMGIAYAAIILLAHSGMVRMFGFGSRSGWGSFIAMVSITVGYPFTMVMASLLEGLVLREHSVTTGGAVLGGSVLDWASLSAMAVLAVASVLTMRRTRRDRSEMPDWLCVMIAMPIMLLSWPQTLFYLTSLALGLWFPRFIERAEGRGPIAIGITALTALLLAGAVQTTASICERDPDSYRCTTQR